MAQKLARGLDVPVAALLDEDELKESDYLDSDIKSFLACDLPGLDAVETEWLRRTISMVRERKREREQYKAADDERR